MKLSLHDFAKAEGWQAANFRCIFGRQDSSIAIVGDDLEDIGLGKLSILLYVYRK